MTAYKLVSRGKAGTDLVLGDELLGFGRIIHVVRGQHPMGAKYQDVVFDTFEPHRCWGGFTYHVLGMVPLTLLNATVAELAELDI